MKKLFVNLFLLLFCVTLVQAVPAYPGLLTKTQPDGTTISYYLRGDESFSINISEDGYLITLNSNGIFEYAKINEQSQIVPVGIKVSSIENRTAKENRYLKNALLVSDLEFDLKQLAISARANTQKRAQALAAEKPVKRYPLSGTPKSIVILVNFADLSFSSSTAQADYTALLNEKGYAKNGGTGSAKDFFLSSSNEVFNPNFVVVGPYTLPKEMSYYGKDYGSGQNRYENYASQMIVDACRAADDDVNFAEYDTDGNGYIDNVFVYYAGHNQAEGADENTVWPHRSGIITPVNLDGVLIRDYACTSELRGNKGTVMCGIGTFCHEFGHVLGLPDFYDTDYSGHLTMGSWDAMDNGPYNNQGRTPPSYSSYERFFLGWLTPTVLENGKSYELEPLVTSNTAFILSKEVHNLDGANPDPEEFFMIENRQRVGWDSIGLPGQGLLVTHIDYSYSDWVNNVVNNDPNDMGAVIVCADRDTKSPQYNTFPGFSKVNTCYLEMKDGYKFPDPLRSITQLENGNISFVYGQSDDVPYITKEGLEFDAFKTAIGTKQIETVTFVGNKINSKVEFRLAAGSYFKVRKQGTGNFSRGVTVDLNEDSTFSCVLEFQFEPTRVTDKDEYLTDKLTVKADNYDIFYELKGTATKAIYITRPEALPATNVTQTSCVANWVEQEKATCYYFSLYSISDKQATEVESFDVFTEDEIPTGWYTNFYTTNKMYTASSPISVIFKTDADTLISKEYFSYVDKISVWVHSYNTNGQFYIDGLIDGEWINILSEKITTTVKKKTLEASLDGKLCRQFRMYYVKAVESNGGLCVDNFATTVFNAPDFINKDRKVSKSGTSVTNLKNDKIYYYRVAASDKNEKLTDDPYEYITPYSEPIKVDLLGGVGVENVFTAPTDLSFVYLNNGTVAVDLGEEPSANGKLYVYSVDGRLVTEISTYTQNVVLSDLVKNNIYIVKYSDSGDMNQVTKFGKLVY